MRVSQNGWPVVGRDLIDPRKIAGVAFPQGFLEGDVWTVFDYLFRRFDAEVESLVTGWCWGWHDKRISGSDDWSNHASGTAGDVNAPKHPIGRRGTFSTAQVAAIRRILKALDGVVRWGGDYKITADEMHFEIVGSRPNVRLVANKIRKAADMPREYAMMPIDGKVPELRIGDFDKTGDTQWVWRLQLLLEVADDGVYGPATAAALAERMAGDPKRSSNDGAKCYVPEWRRLYGLWE